MRIPIMSELPHIAAYDNICSSIAALAGSLAYILLAHLIWHVGLLHILLWYMHIASIIYFGCYRKDILYVILLSSTL